MKNDIKIIKVWATWVSKEFARSPNVSNLVGVLAPAFFQLVLLLRSAQFGNSDKSGTRQLNTKKVK